MPRLAALLAACLAALLCAPTGARGDGSDAAAPGGVDVHMHLDGSSDGPPAPGGSNPRRDRPPRNEERRDYTASADDLVRRMDELGVATAIVMPPPQLRGQKGGYTYRDLLTAIARHPGRLVLGAGGGTLNPMIHEIPADRVTNEHRARFRALAEEIVQAGAKAFGEMAALHLCMNPRHHYEAAPPDHPLFLLLADLSAEFGLPIDLHVEAVAEDLPTPPRLREACAQNPATIRATLPALGRLLAHNRRARIVWQHIGWDNTGQMKPTLFRSLLREHENLFLAIKAVPAAESERPTRIHDDAHRILPEWVELFREFPDRIVVGADEFARAPGTQGGYAKPPFFDVTWKAVAGLPADVAEKVRSTNARRIYRLP